MELMRLGPVAEETPAVRENDIVYDISSLTKDIDGGFLAAGGIDRVRQALSAGTLTILDDATSLRVGSPVARPGAVICIGQNYAAHAAESGAEPPTRPIIFFKHPNTVIGPNDSVTIPSHSEKTDWEVELAIVIGSVASRLESAAAAREHIAGWTVADDVSERRAQLEESGGQWSKGKSFPTFSPLGPVLIPEADLSVADVRLRSFVNGEARQDSSTTDMIFKPYHLVYDLSQYLTLEPGDVVLTGTPEGVALSGRFPYLKAGDVVEVEVAGIGRQRHSFTAAV